MKYKNDNLTTVAATASNFNQRNCYYGAEVKRKGADIRE
jgi:hypothetical protein